MQPMPKSLVLQGFFGFLGGSKPNKEEKSLKPTEPDTNSVVEAPSTAPEPTAESAPAPVSAPAATDNIKEEVAQPVVPAAKSKDGFFKKMFHS